jgi:hypothetical protein
MIVEQHDKYKIKLIQNESGYGVSYGYEILENDNLFCRALTLKQARQEINCSSPSKDISLEKTALIENCIKNITYCNQFTTELVKALRISLKYVPNNVILDISEDAFFLSKKESKE